jgi:hypothetical protein
LHLLLRPAWMISALLHASLRLYRQLSSCTGVRTTAVLYCWAGFALAICGTLGDIDLSLGDIALRPLSLSATSPLASLFLAMAEIPYKGSRICLISKSEIRYEGTLFSIDTKDSTVTLQNGVPRGKRGEGGGGGEALSSCLHTFRRHLRCPS